MNKDMRKIYKYHFRGYDAALKFPRLDYKLLERAVMDCASGSILDYYHFLRKRVEGKIINKYL